LAAEILKVGQSRVRIDPSRTDDVEAEITREGVRRLIHEKVIISIPKKGVSRSRTRLHNKQKKIGRRRGSGSRSGKKTARTPKKKKWKNKIRALRNHLRESRDRNIITKKVYRRLYLQAKGGIFNNVSDLNKYIESYRLTRRR
jgi:large subunit ribosomal protein L19e